MAYFIYRKEVTLPEEANRKVGLSNGLIFIIKPFDADSVRLLAKKLSTRATSAFAG